MTGATIATVELFAVSVRSWRRIHPDAFTVDFLYDLKLPLDPTLGTMAELLAITSTASRSMSTTTWKPQNIADGVPMTLLLGAITNDAAVLGADGIEFEHYPNSPKKQGIFNRRKLYTFADSKVVLGLHGQNRLAPEGATLDQQRLVIEILPEIASGTRFATVRELCQLLFDRLTPDVLHTFTTLADASISAAPMGILAIGFDDDGSCPQCFEAWWPLENTATDSRIIDHSENARLPTVMHSGDGTRFAKTAISHGGRYHVDRLKKSTLPDTQDFVRRLYRKAESLQSRGVNEFGGDYHEVTVTKAGAKWTTPCT